MYVTIITELWYKLNAVTNHSFFPLYIHAVKQVLHQLRLRSSFVVFLNLQPTYTDLSL